MSQANDQQQQQLEKEDRMIRSQELPLQSSPYVKYSELEEYKQNAYGTQGHLPVSDTHRGPGATDGPTPSGAGISEAEAACMDPLNRQASI